ncbi:MAG TPA: hypothetical protein VFE72_09035 [Lysobacter sp.]|nr:hypothetical protein [Lysobacter sp.]
MFRRACRRHRRFLRLFAIAILALAVLARPMLSSLGEMHELAHDPSGLHGAGAGASGHEHDTATTGNDAERTDTLHALLHFAHCCGQASAVPLDARLRLPAGIAHARPMYPLDAALSRGRWATPFRPPIRI